MANLTVGNWQIVQLSHLPNHRKLMTGYKWRGD